ncbi:hypothetical protein D3C85_1934960 [compost metagenome]
MPVQDVLSVMASTSLRTDQFPDLKTVWAVERSAFATVQTPTADTNIKNFRISLIFLLPVVPNVWLRGGL